jgi:transcriptional regulator with XRE-family HTH domain
MSVSLSVLQVSSYQPMKAPLLLAQNIAALLKRDGLKQKDLADWCHHSEVWISAILTGKRDVALRDMDRIADLFNLSAYQLFLPGISSRTERRKYDRRSGVERRIGHAHRGMQMAASDINLHRPRRVAGGSDHPKP